jgi:diacylglycerol kinase (ATP)
VDNKSYYTDKRRKRIKLIFNPISGVSNVTTMQLTDVVRELENWKFVPDVCILDRQCDLTKVVNDTLAKGIHLFAACGGDGTVSSVSKAIAGKRATLGIIPKGTQNNVALSLGIPKDMSASVAILRTGRRIKTDMGMVTCGTANTPFVEICSAGLMSALFPSGDDIQHGHLDRIGDFLATLATCAPSKIKMLLDNQQEIITTGHVVLISNMPYIGRHYQVGAEGAYQDGLLDILLFANLSKVGLLGCAFKEGTKIQDLEDPRIQRFRVRKAEIDTNPDMEIMADGSALGKGAIHVEVKHHSLAVMVQKSDRKVPAEPNGAAI